MSIEQMIANLAETYADKLNQQVQKRVEDMKNDDKSHYLLYQVLKVTVEEGELIYIYQNKGLFLYKY
uniref:ApaLI family restriction endonuclease n=1 Tax=Actinoplanes sp. DH11 TaxID=2857011 RepID=UPI001E4D3EBE